MAGLNMSRYGALKKGLEDYEEAPIAPAVAAAVDGDVVDPQIVTNVDGVQGTMVPTDEHGEMPPAFVPSAVAAPVIAAPAELPIPTPVPDAGAIIPAGAEGEPEVPAADVIPTPEQSGLIIDAPLDSDNTLEMMGAPLAEQSHINNQIGQVLEVRESMEQYVALIKQAGRDGISKQAAAFMRVGLEHCNRVLGTSDLTVGLEDMDAEPRSAIQPSNVKPGGLKDKIKEAGAKVIAWLKEMWAKAKEFTEQFMQGITGLESKLQKAEARAGELGSKPAVTGKVKVPSPEKINVGGKINPTYPKALAGMATFGSSVYPKAMISFYDALASTLGQYDVSSGNSADVIDHIATAARPLDELISDATVYPGNMQLDVANDGMTYGMKQAGGSAEAGDAEVAARSGSTIKADLGTMREVCNTLKQVKAESDKIAASAEKVSQAIEKIEKAAESGELDEKSKSEAGAVVSAAMSILHKTNPRNAEIVKYVARTTSAYVDLCLAEMGSGAQNDKQVAKA